MAGKTSTRQLRSRSTRAAVQLRRDRIIAAAMPLFAEHGYHGARMEDLATALGIAKGSIFQHFGTKERLFIQVYQTAVRKFARYLDVPEEVRQQGFFTILKHWLTRTDHLLREDWIPYRIQLLGLYATELSVKREINRFHVNEDPFGMVDFVRYGLERNELRRDMEIDVIVSFVGWMMERFQDALVVEELDPSLFRHAGASPERKQARINQILDLLQRAIGADPQS